jgi:hypothetical protein
MLDELTAYVQPVIDKLRAAGLGDGWQVRSVYVGEELVFTKPGHQLDHDPHYGPGQRWAFWDVGPSGTANLIHQGGPDLAEALAGARAAGWTA